MPKADRSAGRSGPVKFAMKANDRFEARVRGFENALLIKGRRRDRSADEFSDEPIT